jgi:surface carbohydrate biosynthesis protein
MKKKILVFYDNFVRDYRGLLLLTEILKKLKNKTYLEPLWNDAIEKIKQISPDTVVMGQVGEYSTSKIGAFCHKHGINLVINTTEMVNHKKKIKNFFSYNFSELNSEIIDLQIVPNSKLNIFVEQEIPKEHKKKYSFLGFPRFDLSIEKNFRYLEVENIRKKYGIKKNQKVFLFVSSFIFDEEGGQVSVENKNKINEKEIFLKEIAIKKKQIEILKKLVSSFGTKNSSLIIKKHPWDKSKFFEETFNNDNCIVLEKNEYIVPIIELSDFVIHAESTVAIEAWIQNKKTISFLPEFDGNREKLMLHMKNELIVKNYDELKKAIENYPSNNSKKIFLKNFFPTLDGKTTIRFAKKIDLPTPKKNQIKFKKSIKEKIKQTKWKFFKLFKKKKNYSGYVKHFREIEKNKREITKIYLPAIKKYLKENESLVNS